MQRSAPQHLPDPVDPVLLVLFPLGRARLPLVRRRQECGTIENFVAESDDTVRAVVVDRPAPPITYADLHALLKTGWRHDLIVDVEKLEVARFI